MSITNKAITVISQNGPANCIIDCYDPLGYSHRAFEIQTEEGEETWLVGFKIINPDISPV